MLRLLIVDDEIIVREGLKNLLHWSELGVESIECIENGKKALEFFKNKGADIIICDIRMPLMNGLEFIEEVKHIDKSTLVIFISAYDDFKYAQRAVKLGAYDYILKPIDPDVLKDLITKAIDFKKTEINKVSIPILNDIDCKYYSSKEYKEYLVLKEELSRAMKSADKRLSEEIYKNMYSKINNPQCSIDFIKREAFELVNNTVRSMIEIGGDTDIVFKYDDPWSEICNLKNKEDIYAYSVDYIMRICDYIEENKKYKNKALINKALKLIEEKYSNADFSLNELADILYVTPNYLSTIFKKDMGEGFSEYLNKYRIKKAKEFLSVSVLKIYEVSYKVGYTDAHYFSKIFKSLTGVSPKDYREQLNNIIE